MDLSYNVVKSQRMNIVDFLLGVLSSIVAAFILYLFRSNIFIILNVFFSKLYPNVNGSWRVYLPKEVQGNENQREILQLKQFGSKINGKLHVIVDDEINGELNVFGKISASRILTLGFESPSADHNIHGAYLLKLSTNAQEMTGQFTTICNCCEDSFATHVNLSKK